jgi:hypothetical protein
VVACKLCSGLVAALLMYIIAKPRLIVGVFYFLMMNNEQKVQGSDTTVMPQRTKVCNKKRMVINEKDRNRNKM